MYIAYQNSRNVSMNLITVEAKGSNMLTIVLLKIRITKFLKLT